MGGEKNIENSIKKYLKSIGSHCFSYKVHGDIYTPKGTPDITGCLWGRHFEIEVKQPGEKPTPIQKRMMKKWRRAGAIVGIAYNVDDVKRMLEPYIIRPGDIVEVVAWKDDLSSKEEWEKFRYWFHTYNEVLEEYDIESKYDFKIGRKNEGDDEISWGEFYYTEIQKVPKDNLKIKRKNMIH